MKILQDEPVLDFLDSENDNQKPEFSLKQLQAHIDFKCGCKITQDNKGNCIYPCVKHNSHFEALRDDIILHHSIQ